MTDHIPPLRLGTRASPLAMAQADMVRAALIAAHPGLTVTIMPVVASGDKVLDRALSDVGGKALWTKELDAWLLGDEIDIAVHSMKDVETVRPDALEIAAMLPRADVRDKLIGAASVETLAIGARVGTSAPRRTAQLLRLRPDLNITLFRGNVATRLGKLERGEADATLLAAAGLDRLNMASTGHHISVDTMLPAPAQGAVGIEIRREDDQARRLVNAINHPATFACVMAERTLLAALCADCRSPVAALGVIEDGQIWLRAEIYSEDGTLHEAGDARFAIGDHDAPAALAHLMLRRASADLRAVFG